MYGRLLVARFYLSERFRVPTRTIGEHVLMLLFYIRICASERKQIIINCKSKALSRPRDKRRLSLSGYL